MNINIRGTTPTITYLGPTEPHSVLLLASRVAGIARVARRQIKLIVVAVTKIEIVGNLIATPTSFVEVQVTATVVVARC